MRVHTHPHTYVHTGIRTHIYIKHKFTERERERVYIAYLQKTGYNAFVPTIVRRKYLNTGVPNSRKQTWATLLYRMIKIEERKI